MRWADRPLRLRNFCDAPKLFIRVAFGMTQGVEALPALPVMPPRSAPPAAPRAAPRARLPCACGVLRRLFCCLDVDGRGARWWRSLPAYSGLTPGCWLAE